uniref:F-box/kelch-repeat protein At3g06240-like n=1 Tax=Tanacetum cinerariifolium TaxID=118510 RepID=A0A699L030_TANCI|nr:F-box/kelch-repeat protein At3g06240-like [Tanacetum cinerariifolium]
MASRKQPATMKNLPDDLLYNNIFVRLPAKLLAQMRCVCKPWNAFSSQLSFIKSHLDRSIQNKDEVPMIFEDGFSFGDSKSFTAHTTQSPTRQITDLIKLLLEFNILGGLDKVEEEEKQKIPLGILCVFLS